ncbi:MFS transporter [Paractinoplanes lichenicola]|uniref:MFS transporter n=1 Tax=Paractinoplanes lichenicola TaxID=2802976 RepID=A0ABS1VT22_9ACTN|nr:MFS transporter [Actinoplanes lichenicola]MBL7257618.1 MFS transporter [Actinoplanes lichenicola]
MNTKSTARPWRGLAVLALPTLLLSLDVSVLYVALPRIGADLGATGTEQLWILDIYSFLLAGFLVTMGAVGERVGRRRLLLIGAGAFGVASVLAAYATTPEMLIAARAVLGVAGATIMPSTMALIRTMFTEQRQLNRALGIWFACFMGGSMLGPLVGGALLESFWWGSAFLLGAPIMVLLLIVGPAWLPEFRDRTAPRPDLPSLALSLAAVLPIIHGGKTLAHDGWSLLPLAEIALGVLLAIAFVRRQAVLPHPLLELRLFRNRTVATSLAAMLGGGIVMAGVVLVSSLYLQSVRGLTPLETGLWLVPQNVAMVAGSLLAPALAQRFPTVRVAGGGLVLAAAGLSLLAGAGPQDGIGWLVTGVSVASFGLSMPMTLLLGLMLGSVPPARAGSVASVNETGGEFGIAVGVALLGSLATAVYRDGLPATAFPVREGIAAAAGTPFLDVARVAFTDAVHVIGLVGAGGFALLAALTFRVLRRPAPDAAPEPARVG